jgi:hypothetical protein
MFKLPDIIDVETEFTRGQGPEDPPLQLTVDPWRAATWRDRLRLAVTVILGLGLAWHHAKDRLLRLERSMFDFPNLAETLFWGMVWWLPMFVALRHWYRGVRHQAAEHSSMIRVFGRSQSRMLVAYFSLMLAWWVIMTTIVIPWSSAHDLRPSPRQVP